MMRRLIETWLGRPPRMTPPAELTGLADREHDVLIALAQSLSNTERVDLSVVSETTVKNPQEPAHRQARRPREGSAVVSAYQDNVVAIGSSTEPKNWAQHPNPLASHRAPGHREPREIRITLVSPLWPPARRGTSAVGHLVAVAGPAG